jgi:hypothetical protein
MSKKAVVCLTILAVLVVIQLVVVVVAFNN